MCSRASRLLSALLACVCSGSVVARADFCAQPPTPAFEVLAAPTPPPDLGPIPLSPGELSGLGAPQVAADLPPSGTIHSPQLPACPSTECPWEFDAQDPYDTAFQWRMAVGGSLLPPGPGALAGVDSQWLDPNRVAPTDIDGVPEPTSLAAMLALSAMAMRRRMMRLNRADLPTLGRPTMAMSPDMVRVCGILPVTESKTKAGATTNVAADVNRL